MDNTQLSTLWQFEALLKETVPTDFLRYCLYSLSLNDSQHSVERVYTICQMGQELFDHYQPLFSLTQREKILTMVGCLMCDIGCQYNPQSHHLTGYGLVYEYLRRHWPGEFNEQEIGIIANAVLTHRSAQRYRPTSIVGELVSVAATGRPDIDESILRAVTYSLSTWRKDIQTKEEVIYEVHQFLIDKYGSLGYHWGNYPEFGKAYFKDEWAVFTHQLGQSTVMTEKITRYYHLLFKESWSNFK